MSGLSGLAMLLGDGTDPLEPYLTLDATLEAQVARSADVTASPVERGADVADHRRVKARSFRFSGVIVDVSSDANAVPENVSVSNRDKSFFELDDGLLPQAGNRNIDPLFFERARLPLDDGLRAESQLQKWLDVFDGQDTFKLVTDYETIDRCVLESFTWRARGYRNAYGGAACFDVDGMIVEILFADTQVVAVPPKTSIHNAKPVKDAGTQTPVELPKDSSFLESGIEAVRKF